MLNLEQSRDYLDSIIHNKYIGVTVIDENGIIIYRNLKSEKGSGISNDTALGKHFSTIWPKGVLLDVLRTGNPKFGTTYYSVSGEKTVLHCFPLYYFNKLIGAVLLGFYEHSIEKQKYIRELYSSKTKLLNNIKVEQKGRLVKYSLDDIIGHDKKIVYLKKLTKKYTLSKSSVLITGETGTGKELFAHALHSAGPYQSKPFVRINCASVPSQLLESELFGYESGAFTGAKSKGKTGKFELVGDGTIFLDEIDSMSIGTQAKLLHVLEDKEFEKLGSNKVVRSDFRIITATNKNPEKLIEEKKFREDLYYRLLVLDIDIPPLRKRKADIPYLCDHFIDLFNKKMGLKIMGIDREAMHLILNWRWPGNVRELKNIIERAANKTETELIKIDDLPTYFLTKSKFKTGNTHYSGNGNLIKKEKDYVEKKMIETALENVSWNKSKVAEKLGISRPLLYSLIRKHNLQKPDIT